MDNSTNNNSEMLIRYLDGELEGNEKIEFEKKLAGDNSMQKELENFRLARGVIMSYGLDKKVEGIHRQMMKEMKPSPEVRKIGAGRRIVKYSLAVAASVLFLFVGIEAYNFFRLTPDKVFATNFQHYELSTFRDITAGPSEIEKAYKDKKFTNVIALWQFSQHGDIGTEFLAAMSYLEIKEYANAINGFNRVLVLNRENKTNAWKDHAEYYLALAYIKNGSYNSSLDLLHKIKDDPENLYHSKITDKLLRQVKRLRWK